MKLDINKILNLNIHNQYVEFSISKTENLNNFLYIGKEEQRLVEDKERNIFIAKFLIKNINIFKDTISLQMDDKKYNLEWSDIIGFDKKNILDSKYITKILLSPNVRKFITSNGLLLIWSLFEELSEESPIYPGLLTLSAYRYSENFRDRKFLADFALKKRINLCSSKKDINLIKLRWLVSSGFAISVLAFKDNDYANAELLLNDVLKFESRLEELPFIAMNLYSALLLLCVIKFLNKEYELSFSLCVKLFNKIIPSISLIYNLENRSVLSQTKDCQILLNIGYNALTIAKAIEKKGYTNNLFNVVQGPRHKFSFSTFLHRFGKEFINDNPFPKIEQSINELN